MTFLQEFFKALGITLGSNLASIVTLIGIAFILYVILTSKRARMVIAALKEAVIKRLMLIPFIAESIYDKTISDYEKDLEDWKDYKKDLEAELVSYQSSFEKNIRIIDKFSKKMKAAMKNQDEALAMEYAEQVVVAEDDNKILEEQHIPRMQRAISVTEERMSNLRTLIVKTKARKTNAIRSMKGGKLEERLTDNLSGSNDSEAMLTFFEERAEYQKNRGTGARMAYESSLEYKDQKLDKAILRNSASELLESCKKELLTTKK